MSSEEEVKETPKPLRRVRIQNDGGPGYATRITDADTGQPIDSIFHIRLVDLDVKEIPKVLLWQYTPVIDVTANAEVVGACPCCGKYKQDPQKLNDKFKLKLTVDDTDLDLSIDKLKRLQDLQRATRGNNIYPREAIVAFLEWLSDRKDSQFSSISLGDELSELASLFCEAQGWKFDQEYYDEVIGKVRANYPE